MATTPESTIAANYLQVDSTITAHQRVLLMGPDYVVRKYTNPVTRPTVALGAYTGSLSAVNWPALLAGETVDTTYTRLYLEGAAQRYYLEASRPVADANAILSGYTNRIRVSDRVFANNLAAARSTQFPVDLVAGDWVRLFNGTSTVVARVTQLIADIVLSSIGGPAANVANIATNAGASAASPGGSNTSTAVSTVAALNNPTNYDGSPSRQASETYTLQVTQVGAQGTGITGTWSTVQLSCTSSTGTDAAQTGLVPVVGVPLVIGSRGARVQWSHGGSGNDWVLGDLYTVTVTQAYTVPTLASAGTYTGTSDTNYVVRVTTGGSMGSVAKVSVSTTTGTDVSGPHLVTSATPISIGTQGVTFTLTGTKLYANDYWTVAVTSRKGGTDTTGGAIRTLVVDQAIEATAALFTANWVGQSITVEAAIYGNVEVTANRIGFAPLLNWSQSVTQLTMAAGMITYQARTASLALPVVAGAAYCTYRALRSVNVGKVLSASTEADLVALGMPVEDVDNTLAYAARRAFNAVGTSVLLVAVATDTLAGYQAAQVLVVERPDWSTITPLNALTTVQQFGIDLITLRGNTAYQMPSDTVIPVAVDTVINVVKLRTDTSLSTATIADNPLTPATDYTAVADPLGVFLTAGVQAGYEYRTNYVGDGFGNETYSAYTVASVSSNQQLILVSGPVAPVSPASRYEIWRYPAVTEQANQWVTKANAYNNSLVVPVFPNQVGTNGVLIPGFHLAANLAGIRAGSAPHQGLVTVQLADFTDVPASATFAGQSLVLNSAGGYVIRKLYTGEVVIDSAYTSNVVDQNLRFDSVQRNINAISWYLRGVFEKFRGHTNVVDSNIANLTTQFQAAVNFLKARSVTDDLGGMIISGAITAVRRHATIKDRVVVVAAFVIPGPMNSVEFSIAYTV